MTFSWAQQIAKAHKMKQRREHIKALNPTKDYKIEHPDWCREASQNKFTMLDKAVKEKLDKHVELALMRRERRVSG